MSASNGPDVVHWVSECAARNPPTVKEGPELLLPKNVLSMGYSAHFSQPSTCVVLTVVKRSEIDFYAKLSLIIISEAPGIRLSMIYDDLWCRGIPKCLQMTVGKSQIMSFFHDFLLKMIIKIRSYRIPSSNTVESCLFVVNLRVQESGYIGVY